MRRSHRVWLVSLNIAIGVIFTISCLVTWLLVVTDGLGLTSTTPLLRTLSAWQQPLILITIVVFASGTILYTYLQRRRGHANDGTS